MPPPPAVDLLPVTVQPLTVMMKLLKRPPPPPPNIPPAVLAEKSESVTVTRAKLRRSPPNWAAELPWKVEPLTVAMPTKFAIAPPASPRKPAVAVLLENRQSVIDMDPPPRLSVFSIAPPAPAEFLVNVLPVTVIVP